MNGVRRFLGGGGFNDTQSPGPPASLNLDSPPFSAAPLASASTASAYSNYSDSPGPSIQPTSPTTKTAALFLKKKDKTRPSLGGGSGSQSSIDAFRAIPVASTSNVTTRARSNTAGSSSLSANGLTKKSLSGSRPIHRNTRDDLLLSLLASEAVVESRDFAILSSEEIDELKKEEAYLSSRLASLEKRLETERKIRDAATTLSALSGPRNSNSKSPTSNEQLETATKRFEETQKEVWRLSQAKSDVSRRLVEHRAGVLSESVRRIEEDKRGDMSNGYGTPANPTSPPSSAFSFFAGHPSSAVPNSSSVLPQATEQQISQLEEQLRAATASLSEASKKQAEATRELNMLKLEKDQVETMLGMELQTAQEKTASLENEVLPELETEVENLKQEKDYWEQERDAHQGEKTRWENERTMLEEMQQAKGGADAILAEVRQNMQSMQEQLDTKEGNIRQLQTQLSQSQKQLSQTQSHLSQLEQSHAEAIEDLDSGRASIQSLVQTHAIVLFSRDSSLKGLLSAIGTHLEGLSIKLLSIEQASAQKEAEHRQRETDWEAQKRRLEEDVRMGFDKREGLSRELDIVRRERENMRREMTELKDSAAVRSSPSTPSRQLFSPATSFTSIAPSPPTLSLSTLPIDNIEYTSPEALSIISALKPLWAILPSPEARAAKFASSRERAFRTGSGPSSPTMSTTPSSPAGNTPKSISDLDVRSLKSLYDSTKNPSSISSPQSEFTLSSFISRVQSLLTDDRLLIERLLRFAQAHDLLKKNADRAQKLASEANSGLETYQRQVRILEGRNGDLIKRCGELQGEVTELQGLQEVVDRISAAKSDIEIQAAEQAETCRQLTEANNTLSARALALAEEAAQAPDMIRRQMQKELDDVKAQLAATRASLPPSAAAMLSRERETLQELEKAKRELREALEEMEAMQTSTQTQNVMLMDELMVTQSENADLKNQLRALKK
ncbi:Up-regulated during septation-domain-containing protein [Lentinula aciculospora]|uniref:Up-regulated during septation-domain-containing protein n=1 Tax=Lentinula aciculospora TaxID=153920 RepID=A0A9W9AEI5_9AGAR|nr:Up-regulated during septation-domain-containing protein [Lentinula aciculospora]